MPLRLCLKCEEETLNRFLCNACRKENSRERPGIYGAYGPAIRRGDRLSKIHLRKARPLTRKFWQGDARDKTDKAAAMEGSCFEEASGERH